MRRPLILLIDEDEDFFQDLKLGLPFANLLWAKTIRKAGTELRKHSEIDLILLDLKLNQEEEEKPKKGLQFLQKIRRKYPLIPVFIVSHYAERTMIVDSMKGEADDYLYKGDREMPQWRKKFQDRINVKWLEESYIKAKRHLLPLLGSSEAVKTLHHEVDKLCKVARHMALIGETGTGKHSFIKYLHSRSGRYGQRPIKLNGKTATEKLRIWFGGGKISGEKNPFEAETGSILFLDQIQYLSPDVVEHLLDYINDHPIKVAGKRLPALRIAVSWSREKASWNQRSELVRLFSRLYQVNFVPLRKRKEDLMPIITHFFKTEGYESISNLIHPQLLEAFHQHPFHGNFAELHCLLNTILTKLEMGHSARDLRMHDLPTFNPNPTASPGMVQRLPLPHKLDDELAYWEAKYIDKALGENPKSKEQAAALLHINAGQMRHRVKRLVGDCPQFCQQFRHICQAYPQFCESK